MNKSTWQTRFRQQFYGQLNYVDDTGGFDAKLYLEAFIERELDRKEKEEKRIADERVKNAVFYAVQDERHKLLELLKDEGTLIDGELVADMEEKVRNQLRAELRQALEEGE
jgi:hypothetical protein